MLRIVLAGSVFSSRATLQSLVEHKLNVVGVLGYESPKQMTVSGYADLSGLCRDNEIPYRAFTKINDEAAQLKAWEPDVFFVVGLSQLVSSELLSIPRLGCVGFHPTRLPRGRGRAPVAWLVLEEQSGAATFFQITSGIDDGPIFVQEDFEVLSSDSAEDVCNKIEVAIGNALSRWLPSLREGRWNAFPQNEAGVSYYGKRAPEDGLVDWQRSAQQIDRLIKATSKPHPGAYTFFDDTKVVVWSSSIESALAMRGVPGRILLQDPSKGYLIQCGSGVLWISDLEFTVNSNEGKAPTLRVGDRLGYYSELEVYELKRRISALEHKLQ